MTAIKLCTDLIYADQSDNNSHSSNSIVFHSSGHFYTNDIKVLVDIITRELRNIPFQDPNDTTNNCIPLMEYRYMYNNESFSYLIISI
mmetsp:Transcript_32300/g.44137  ORF Transcript_32300/g.44137 Transcript_32300/m.44137 type:complete len:88 (-) Transcript_32300:135-398(-)